uniref:Protein kinase domain-containing protein n=1 Tax=Steinernema glaseri TaxID=37863 RepID=A0A1I7ZDA1_9BILA
MASVLSSFFARDPKSSFAYEIPTERFHTTSNGISLGKSFKKADPNELATCFSAEPSNAGVLNTQITKLRTMRHPNVLTFVDSLESDSGVHLITEPCQPLCQYIADASFSQSQLESFVSWGMYQLMNCLSFLHKDAKLSHNSVRISIYVTPAGDWKLSGFEKSSSFESAKYDLCGLGMLIWEIFNGFNPGLEKPTGLGKVPNKLGAVVKKMFSPSANRSPSAVGDLLQDCRKPGGFLRNKFVETLLFLEEFQIREAREKQQFFVDLKEHLDIFPDDIAKYKILPKLIHSYEYGDAGAHILVPMFKLGRLLDANEYQQRIVPCLCKLFSSTDRATRVKLLEQIDEFAPHLTNQVVNEKIYGNIILGFNDTSPAMRESTVKAMVPLAEKLNAYNLNTDLMRHFARLQGSDDQPGIRTNVTICLGKIAGYLDPSNRAKILIGAFTRALRDPFTPSRSAGVLGLSATQQFYTLVDVANRVIPALCPLTCDPEKSVRDQAFKALHGFLGKLEKASENPELIPELESEVRSGGRGGILNSEKVPQWASWAIKSISGKFYKAPANQQAQPQAEEKETTNRSPALSVRSEALSGSGSESGKHVVLVDVRDEEEPEVDADDWSSGWETPSVDVAPAKTSSQLASSTAARIGALKLVRKEMEDLLDLDDNFGASNKPKPDMFKPKAASNASSGGWDDFDDEPVVQSPSGTSGWDNDGWDDGEWGAAQPEKKPAPVTSASTALTKEQRRAQMQARNEKKKKELEAKRKGLGAMKLT